MEASWLDKAVLLVVAGLVGAILVAAWVIAVGEARGERE